MDTKNEKLKEVIREAAATYFSRESNRTSLITITNVELFARNSRAKVLFTVLPETQEQAALDFMNRQLTSFREYVMENTRIMRVPFFEIAIDTGEKNRQHIDALSRNV